MTENENIFFDSDSEQQFNIPATLAGCADRLAELKKQRLSYQKLVKNIEREEAFLSSKLKAELKEQGSRGIAGLFSKVAIVDRKIPSVTDWDALHAHIQRTGEFDLMQRRLSDAAVKERWNAGEEVAGIGFFETQTLSITKI